MKLIIPMGGLSKRYGVNRPKWLLTHPDGSYMIEKAIECLDPEKNFTSIHLILTAQVLSEFNIDRLSLIHEIFEPHRWKTMIKLQVLNGSSSSQLETVARGIAMDGLSGPAMIKDCDNTFRVDSIDHQGVIIKTVQPQDDVRRLQMKCFAQIEDGMLTSMHEKKMSSPHFAAGGYVFDDCAALPGILERVEAPGRELYMSDAVNYLLRGGALFKAIDVRAYKDWGTMQDWVAYCSTYLNLIIDIDGVLLKNGSRVLDPQWGEQDAIMANVDAIRALQAGGRTKIIFATARPNKYRKITRRQLSALGLDVSGGLLMGLFHAKRLLVNDFGGFTSPYPSAEAWSVLRDSNQLAEIIAGQRKNFG